MKAFLERVDPVVVATMGIDMHGRWCKWSRWSPEEAGCMNDLFMRPTVQKQLAIQFATRLDGPLPTTLCHFLRQPVLDNTLPMLARKARLAGVRAVALRVLLLRKTSWQTGLRREWINKVYAISRNVPVLAHREVLVSVDRDDVISIGLRDKSAMVRRTTLAALVRCVPDCPDLAAFMPALLQDRNPSVRRWTNYLRRQQDVLKAH